MKKLILALLGIATLATASAVTGALPGKFSVSETKQVQFSQGNLQYLPASNVWRFAPNQYDVIADTNQFIAPKYGGWIDLFGWGTSGWNGGAVAYKPTSKDPDCALYFPGGNPDNNLTDAYEGSDWGIFNPILNGGNKAGLWYTLSSDEWNYLINERPNAARLRGFAMVGGVRGYILLPDNFLLPDGLKFDPSATTALKNVYISGLFGKWKKMEEAGAVFLPAGGYRRGAEVVLPREAGYYWSSTAAGELRAHSIFFDTKFSATHQGVRAYGQSVRLVTDGQRRTPPEQIPEVVPAAPATTTVVVIPATTTPPQASIATTTAAAQTIAAAQNTPPAPTNPTIAQAAAATAQATATTPTTTTAAANTSTSSARQSTSNKTQEARSTAPQSARATTPSQGAQRATQAASTTTSKCALEPHPFTVGYKGEKVCFAPGNLQYQASSDTWRFASQQYKMIGKNNCNLSGSYAGWIDLFGWGTSGWNSCNPFTITKNPTSYAPGEKPITGTQYDWGVHNTIGNDPAGTWRAPTSSEWIVLLNDRPHASQLYSQGTVNGVCCLIILPDDWQLPAGLDFKPKAGNFTTNTYNGEDWTFMEEAGAVCLPAAGIRRSADNKQVELANTTGTYWSASFWGESQAGALHFVASYVEPNDGYNRDNGCSVRLIRTYVAPQVTTTKPATTTTTTSTATRQTPPAARR